MRLLPGGVCGVLALSALAAAAHDTTNTRPLFDPAAMVLPGVDVSRYSQEEYFPPGNYLVDVVVNQRMRGRDTIRFVLSGSGKLRPCMDVKLLEHFSIDVSRAPLADVATDREATEKAAGCANALAAIQFSEAWFNHRQLVLNITVPQVAIVREVSTRSIDLSKLEDGVPAGIVSYTFNNYFRDTNTASAVSAQYLGVNGRFNVGPWRLFWGGSAQMGTGTSGLRWRNSVFYGERAFNPLNARLAFGQIQSTGDLLPGVPLLGVRLNTDPGTLPAYNARSLVQGVARSQARVVLRQNGVVVYETTVSPGPFSLDEFNPPAPLDVLVTVEEADGTASSFVVPYIRPAQLMKPGSWRFDASAGRANTLQEHGFSNPNVVQASVYYGLHPAVTTYGGIQLASGGSLAGSYGALAAGATLASAYGAFSADVTATRGYRVEGGAPLTDRSYRLSYQYSIQATGTDLALAGYRYSGSNYMSLLQAITAGRSVSSNAAQLAGINAIGGERQRIDLSFSQPVAKGRLSLRLAVADYRSAVTNALNSYYLSYSRMFGEVRTFFTYDRTDVAGRPAVNRLGLSFSVPLGPREAGSSRSVIDTYVSTAQGVTSVSHSTNYATRLNDQPYNISGSYGYGASDPTDGTLGLGVASAFNAASLAAGMSVNSKSRTFSVSGSGALVAHEGGVTFLRSAPDTAALVHAPGAAGASVRGGTRIDDAGYGLVYLVPLQDNIVEIDTRGAEPDLELKSSRKYAAPSRGAYLKVEFEPREGRSVLIEGTTDDGKPLPFGARVTYASGAEVGIVGQGGNIFARVSNNKGQLRVTWGPEDRIACDLNYELQDMANGMPTGNQPTPRALPNLTAACNFARVSTGSEMVIRDSLRNEGSYRKDQ